VRSRFPGDAARNYCLVYPPPTRIPTDCKTLARLDQTGGEIRPRRFSRRALSSERLAKVRQRVRIRKKAIKKADSKR
jgi:hypothetical protein